MTDNLKDIYIEEFSNDPVYRMVLNSRLEGYLFPDSFLEIDMNKTYSTIEVGKFIGRKDSTIRNYFNTELLDYIQPEKVGNLYRLDYIMIFKIHMISLLFDKGKKSKTQIAYELGLSSAVKLGSKQELPESIKEQNADIDKIKTYSAMFGHLINQHLSTQNKLQELIDEKYEKQAVYNQLKTKKDILLNGNVKDNYFNALKTAVDNLAELENTNTKLLKETQEKRGLFKWFTKKKQDEAIQEETTNVADTVEKISNVFKGTREEQEENNEEIKQINEQMEVLKKEVAEKKEEIDNLKTTAKNLQFQITNVQTKLPITKESMNKFLLEGGEFK